MQVIVRDDLKNLFIPELISRALSRDFWEIQFFFSGLFLDYFRSKKFVLSNSVEQNRKRKPIPDSERTTVRTRQCES